MSEALRVLHVSTWNVRCGIATYCANLVKSLDAAGVENDVFALEPHRWPFYLKTDVDRLIRDIAEKAKGFDLVHIQHEHGLFGAALGMGYSAKTYARVLSALEANRVPVLTTFHTEITPASSGNQKISRRIKDWMHYHRWYARIARHFGTQPGKAQAIVHSPQTRYTFCQIGVPADSIHVLRHACLPKKELSLEKSDAKAQLGFYEDDVVLTMFGFVGAYKGHDLAVEALKRLPENYRLAICGGSHPESRDGFLSELLSRVKKAKMTDRVNVTGWISPEVADVYYAATDICLAPYRVSSNLSASGAITWALGSGRPIIASRIDAFQEIQREGDCMFMVTPEATSELAWAIETLQADPVHQARLVESASKYIDKHSWPATTAKILKLYEKMTNARPGAKIRLHKAA